MNDPEVRRTSWQQDHTELRRIRERVFIAEQAVPPELEWDAEDAHAIHFLAFEGEFAVGTARLLADGHIGRVAVLRDWRHQGIGLSLMQAALQQARQLHLPRAILSAQTQAIPFYQRLGFQVTSGEYLDAGMPHVEMQCLLS